MHMSSRRLEQFRRETERDPVLSKIRACIRSEWPEDKSDMPHELKPYHSFRDELVEMDGLIMKDNRIVVPTSLQREMLNILHESHIGVVKLKMRARNIFF